MKPVTVNIWLKNSERIISYIDGEMLNAYELVPYKVYNMTGEILDRGIKRISNVDHDTDADDILAELVDGFDRENTEWYFVQDYELEFLFK